MTEPSAEAVAAAAAEREAAREAILAAALTHVPFDGWTMASLKRGAVDAGQTEMDAERLFPGGVRELVKLFSDLADREMLAGLASHDLEAMRVRERVALGVRLRLEHLTPHREAVRRLNAYLAQPQHTAFALQRVYRTVDAIWYAAGDTATDFNFYTKRGLLAGVYGATVLFWLTDKSEDSAESWAFLDRRIADAMRIPQLTGRLGRVGRLLPDPFRLFRLVAARR